MNNTVRNSYSDEVRRRTQKIQKMLTLRDPESTEAEPAAGDEEANAPAAYTGPPPCRAALAHWPVEWRERWGRLANQLEESGLHWQEAEARAFVEVWNQRRSETKAEPIASNAIGSERN